MLTWYTPMTHNDDAGRRQSSWLSPAQRSHASMNWMNMSTQFMPQDDEYIAINSNASPARRRASVVSQDDEYIAVNEIESPAKRRASVVSQDDEYIAVADGVPSPPPPLSPRNPRGAQNSDGHLRNSGIASREMKRHRQSFRNMQANNLNSSPTKSEEKQLLPNKKNSGVFGRSSTKGVVRKPSSWSIANVISRVTSGSQLSDIPKAPIAMQSPRQDNAYEALVPAQSSLGGGNTVSFLQRQMSAEEAMADEPTTTRWFAQNENADSDDEGEGEGGIKSFAQGSANGEFFNPLFANPAYVPNDGTEESTPGGTMGTGRGGGDEGWGDGDNRRQQFEQLQRLPPDNSWYGRASSPSDVMHAALPGATLHAFDTASNNNGNGNSRNNDWLDTVSTGTLGNVVVGNGGGGNNAAGSAGFDLVQQRLEQHAAQRRHDKTASLQGARRLHELSTSEVGLLVQNVLQGDLGRESRALFEQSFVSGKLLASYSVDDLSKIENRHGHKLHLPMARALKTHIEAFAANGVPMSMLIDGGDDADTRL